MTNLLEKENFDHQTVVPCSYKDDCSGCQSLGVPYGAQIEAKKEQLKQLLSSFSLHSKSPIRAFSAGPAFLRDRLDFSLEEGRLGLYRKEQRQILDLPTCSQLSPELSAWLSDFREQFQWPFKKGSIRLRVGPQGHRGVWLDFANVDIKALLDEQTLLRRLQQQAFVEIGQRRKVPVWTGQEYKLRDPELHVWFQTWIENRPVDLYCQVASFTQPSLRANKIICDIINTWIQTFPRSRLIEFGSGIGNLTLPAAAVAESILACEIDELSLEGLRKTIECVPADLRSLQSKIQIHRGDFQKKLTEDFSRFDGVMANPPRSGLMGFLNPLGALSLAQRPRFFIYMSCFPESMARDMARLQDYGYELQETFIVDQFPQTHHYEVLGLLQRKQS
ncbi:MAG: RNA methyltransferase [Bdellovibrio sp. ArHS]|uniref:class I SAM-dependent RNA methyltransferase n=1 Tax=Bdellovibrio sp. ArHS TaxID=1569284 RepID=UPI0005828FD3|nr:class I SAM-dependent RNA methyltransferase [Bdellovibrio sp. ArHS]KHD88817.1 MAG: RNA methyltransferase [Bdellovibrio sp. ArHS]